MRFTNLYVSIAFVILGCSVSDSNSVVFDCNGGYRSSASATNDHSGKYVA